MCCNKSGAHPQWDDEDMNTVYCRVCYPLGCWPNKCKRKGEVN